MYTYNYIKSPVSAGTLTTEIDDSSIEVGLDYIIFKSPDSLSITFSGSLSSENKDVLDSVVSNHDGVQPKSPAVLPSDGLPENMIPISDGADLTTWISMSDLVYAVIGANEYETSAEAESSTTSTSWQRKLRLSLSGIEAGKYKIKWYYEWAYGNSNSQFKSQLQIDNADTYMEQEVRPTQASTSKYRDADGFVYVNLTAGDHDVDLDYCSSRDKKTACIRRARVSVRRVS